ncbi:MAG: CHAT domain-containing tetratricopeptide repeat protein [Cyanobacteria bacterium P01_F01_bin.150]
MAQTLQPLRTQADTLREQGDRLRQNGEIFEAIAHWQQAIEIYREENNQYWLIMTLSQLGQAYEHYNIAQATDYYEEALAIARETGDCTWIKALAEELGFLYINHSSRQQLITELFDERAQAEALLAQGRSCGDSEHIRTRQRPESITLNPSQHQQIEGQLELGDRVLPEGFHYDLYTFDGQVGQALSITVESNAFQPALVLGDGQEIITTSFDMDSAEHRASITLSLPETTEYTLLVLTEGYYELGTYRLTIDATVNDVSKHLAIQALQPPQSIAGMNAPAPALIDSRLTEGQTLVAQEIEGQTLVEQGIQHRANGEYTIAIQRLEQALAVFQATADDNSVIDVRHELGATFLAIKHFEQAEQQFQAAAEIWNLDAQTPVFDPNELTVKQDTHAKTYDLWQYALVAQNKFAEALDVSEQGRTRGLVHFLSQRYLNNTLFFGSDGQAFIAGVRPFIASGLGTWKGPVPDATLVEYSIINKSTSSPSSEAQKSELYIWVIKPTGEIIFRQQPLSVELTELVQTTRQSIGVRGRGRSPNRAQASSAESMPKLRQLHEVLIQPIADLLPTDEQETVLFVPDESLFLVPFAALLDSDSQYLIEHHTIQIIPSITVLEFFDDRYGYTRPGLLDIPSHELVPLIVGNPVMPSLVVDGNIAPPPLARLPWAQREAEAIATILQTPALIGSDATEERVKRRISEANIIHFATHGLLDDFSMEREAPYISFDWPGAIAFTANETDDGWLTSQEIANLSLNAHLVVLSACDTGQGTPSGDGVVGLSRAFMAAGVPNLLVSLWAVDDLATAELIERFYQEWHVSRNKAQAIRRAMLESIDEYPDPLDWAAFTLVGQIE